MLTSVTLNKSASAISQSATPVDFASKPQLDALTSLRFFAAAMIVLHHATGHFFAGSSLAKTWQLGQGVLFFFVLSGFILTYVYPNLDSLSSIKRFLFSRLGRIWPSHLLTACLTLWLLPYMCPTANILWTNLLLLQSWIPDEHYYFSLNPVAWSISDELFFYVCFIGLIRPWRSGWIGKIALGFGLVLLSCFVAYLIASSGTKQPNDLNEYYLLGINPLARLAEFILGMVTARLWLRFGHQIPFNKWMITVLELVVVAVVLIEISPITNVLSEIFPVLKEYVSLPLALWLAHSGVAPLFALLIFVFAAKNGYLSQALANPIFVWLGEISYSIYMVHWLLIQCFVCYMPEFFKLNCWLGFFIYSALVILIAYINFALVESPCRKLVKTFASSSSLYHGMLNLFGTNFRSTIAAVLLTIGLVVATAAYINTSQTRFQFVDLNSAKNIHFENRFALEKVYVASAIDGSKIKLNWQSLVKQRLKRNVGIYLLDAHGNILTQHDYRQDLFYRTVNPGQLWSDNIYIPACERKGWTSIGVVIYKTDKTDIHSHLSVNGGQRDWWDTRAIIPVSKEALQVKNASS